MNPELLLEKCRIEGELAGKNCNPNASSTMPEGLCGSARVKIKPARGKFVTYLKKNNIGSRGVYGGYEISVGEFLGSIRGTQSIDRQEACAMAVTEILRAEGINAYPVSELL